MQSAKKVVASAQAGMEKTKAVVQEKVEKMKTKDPIQKDMATEKKQAKINDAEMLKQQAYGQNAAGKHTTTTAAPGVTAGSYTNSTTGHPTETNKLSSLLGHGTGHTAHATDGAVGSHAPGTHTTTTVPPGGTAGSYTNSTTGQPTGTNKLSSLLGHGKGHTAHATDSAVGSYPAGTHNTTNVAPGGTAGSYTNSTTGQPTGTNKLSSLLGHGKGHTGHATDGAVGSYPAGTQNTTTAAPGGTAGSYTNPTTGHPTGTNKLSSLLGHGKGHTAHATDGAVGSHPAEKHTTTTAAPGGTAGSYTNSMTGHPAGTNKFSSLLGHCTGHKAHTTDSAVGSHPVETDPGLHGTTTYGTDGTRTGHHTGTYK